MNYFSNLETLQAVKQTYRELVKTNHPDKGGNLAVMQEINKQYANAINVIAKGGNLTEEEVEAEIINAEAYKNAINAIINLTGIDIEVCGGWIWVSGNTYPHKDTFKTNGFYFASKKVKWYFRSVEYKTSNSKPKTMEQIRSKYGSQVVKTSFQKCLS